MEGKYLFNNKSSLYITICTLRPLTKLQTKKLMKKRFGKIFGGSGVELSEAEVTVTKFRRVVEFSDVFVSDVFGCH